MDKFSPESHWNYAIFRTAWSQYECAPDELNPSQRQEAERRVETQLKIESAVLSAEEAQGVTLSTGQLKLALEEIRNRFDSAQAFEQALENAGIEQDALQESLQREQLLEAILDRVCSSLPAVTSQDAEIFYFMHPEKFSVGERREARHILITVNNDYPENEQAAALKRIELIHQRLMKKPSRFEEQAQKHSECPTAMHGGLIGTVEKGKLYAELETHLFNMKEGEISLPIESGMGYHILYCGKIDSPRQVPIEEVLPKVRDSLEQRQRSKFQREWIAERMRQLEEPAKVVNA